MVAVSLKTNLIKEEKVMTYKKRLKEKIEKSKKLIEDFRALGIHAELDEKTGEVLINGSEFNNYRSKK